MTPHVLDQLPFWVGGDLDESELAAVEAHLSQCPACSQAAEEFKVVQAWLQEDQAASFGEADRTRLRHNVMTALSAEARPASRRLRVRRGLLAAAALLVAGLGWRLEHSETAPIPAPSKAKQTAVTPTLPANESRPTVAAAPNSAPRLRRIQPHTESPPGPEAGPTRIEFQTADPNVRIIWLAQAKPLPNLTEVLPEEP